MTETIRAALTQNIRFTPFDTAGNLTGEGMGTHPAGREDAENHMVSVDWSPTTPCGYANNDATVCYTYDALGQRVQATYGGNSYHDIAEWLFDPSGAELSECETGFGAGNGQCWYASWVRLGGRSIAGYWPTNFTAFNHADNLGSTTLATLADGTVATDTQYYPFGVVWQSGGRGMWDIHFAGMQYPETNFNPWLMPTPNRKYYPNLCRWMTPDPAGGHIEDPQTLNKYAYVRNNPTSLTDPSGLDFYLQCADTKDHEGCAEVTDNSKSEWVQANNGGDAIIVRNDKNGNLVDQNGNRYSGTVDSSGVHLSEKGGDTSYSGAWVNGSGDTKFTQTTGALAGFSFDFSQTARTQSFSGTFSADTNFFGAKAALEKAGFSVSYLDQLANPVEMYNNWSLVNFRSAGDPGTGRNSVHVLLNPGDQPGLTVPTTGKLHGYETNPQVNPFEHWTRDLLGR